MSGSPSSTESVRREPLDRSVLAVFSGLMLAMLAAALDQTVVATALPSIVTDIGGLTQLSWVVTAFVLAICVSTPIIGKLADIFPRKTLMQIALLTFLVGSALCGLAQSMPQLIACRALQGVGAAGIMVLSQAIIGDLISPAERGRYQGFMQAAFALATVSGPLIGGVAAETIGWRWIFYLNLPVIAAAMIVIAVRLERGESSSRNPVIDWWGIVLLSSAVSLLVLIAGWGGTTYRWTSAPIIVMSLAAAVLLVAFVQVQRKTAEPLMPLRLFANPVTRVVALLVFTQGFVTLGISTFMPLYLQLVHGASPVAAGLRMAPMMFVMAVTAFVCGRAITKLGRYRVFPIAGTLTLLVGVFLLAQLGISTPTWFQVLGLALCGAGLGLTSPVMMLAAQNATEARDLGVTTSTTTFSRTMGGSLGLAVLGTVFATSLTSSTSSGAMSGTVRDISHHSTTFNRAELDALSESARTELLTHFAQALHAVLLTALGAAAIGCALAFLLQERPLRRTTRGKSQSDPDTADEARS